MKDVSCRSCGSNQLSIIGPLPPAKQFGGVHLDEWLPGGHLFECSKCALVFRARIPAAAMLEQLYRQAPPAAWQSKMSDRFDWTFVASELNQRTQSLAVLDVGCYDGAFLDKVVDKREQALYPPHGGPARDPVLLKSTRPA